MAVNSSQILVGVALVLAVIILAVCIAAPWRRRLPNKRRKAPKKVRIDTTKNKEYSPEPEEPEKLPPVPDEPDESENELNGSTYSKDTVLREAQNTHRNQLMRGAGTSNMVGMPSPTTAALMMGSMTDTRTEHSGRLSQGSTALMERITNAGEIDPSSADVSPVSNQSANYV